MLGSTLFRLTWKVQTTPSGQSLFALVASAARTGDTAITGWPTARATDGNKNVRTLEGALAEIARKGSPQDLIQAAHLTGWPTPTVGNATGSQNMTGMSATGRRADGSKGTVSLPGVASLAGWATPMKRDTKGSRTGGALYTERNGRPLNEQVANLLPGPARLTASGQMLIGSCAETKNGGQLNPEHSRWIQGLPPVFGACAPLVMPSTRKSRASS